MAENYRKSSPENGVESAPNSGSITKGKSSYRTVVVPRSVNARSKISNGTDLLMGIDGRTATARRYRDLYASIAADQGGIDRLSEARAQLIRRFAAASVLAEMMEARLVGGENIDLQEYSQLASTLVRLGQRIGIDRRVRNVTPTLAEYLEAKANEHDAEAAT
jgi:hypothetical protein